MVGCLLLLQKRTQIYSVYSVLSNDFFEPRYFSKPRNLSVAVWQRAIKFLKLLYLFVVPLRTNRIKKRVNLKMFFQKSSRSSKMSVTVWQKALNLNISKKPNGLPKTLDTKNTTEKKLKQYLKWFFIV